MPTTTSQQLASQNGHPHTQRLTLTGRNLESLDRGASLGDIDEQGWRRWQEHLHRRKRPQPLAKLTGESGTGALCWALPDDVDSATRDLLDVVDKAIRKPKSKAAAQAGEFLEPWLAEAAASRDEVGFAAQSLAWAHALPTLARTACPSLWCELLTFLLQTAEDAAAISLIESPLAHQLLAGELPLTLAYLLPEVDECRGLNKPARAALSEGALTLLDGEGLPQGKYLPIARGLLACWTRATLLADGFKKGCFDADGREQYQWLVRQSLRLTRPDGGQMLASPQAGAWNKKLLAAALAAGGDAADRRIAAKTLPGKSSPDKSTRRMPKPAVNSEWAEVAVLRTSWSPQAPRLAVNYHGGHFRSELCAGRHVVWSGECQPQLSVGGERVATTEDWAEVCWFSDDDVDYLEIELTLADDWKIQRQILLARKDMFLLVADAVLGPRDDDLHYRCNWPIVDTIRTRPAKETAECTLVAGKQKINALPLALPEWRCDGRRAGGLAPTDDGLRYELARRGRRLYAPLLFDLNGPRAKKEFTWRQLTVGENLEPSPHDVAVGYRVQLGIQHWLLYRSLAAVGNRTVLGQNTFHEFICGRFDCEGEVDSLIEVE